MKRIISIFSKAVCASIASALLCFDTPALSKNCTVGIPCGQTCISANDVCHIGTPPPTITCTAGSVSNAAVSCGTGYSGTMYTTTTTSCPYGSYGSPVVTTSGYDRSGCTALPVTCVAGTVNNPRVFCGVGYSGTKYTVTTTTCPDGSYGLPSTTTSAFNTNGCVLLPTQNNKSDSWWNSNESGWGLNITDHGTNMFVQWYTYDQTGHNEKFIIAGGTFSSDRCKFSGTLTHVTGPSWTLATFDPSLVFRTNAGSATLDFCPPGLPTGTVLFDYTADGVTGQKQLAQLSFGDSATNWSGTASTTGPDFTDLWWNPNESGWGVSITQHGSNVFARIFVYDVDNRPLLFIMPGATFANPYVFFGVLQTATGPWFGSATFDPNQVNRVTVGTATFSFSDANNGTLTYTVNGIMKTIAITRLSF